MRAKKVLKRHQDKALIYDDGDFVDSTSAVWPDLLSLTVSCSSSCSCELCNVLYLVFLPSLLPYYVAGDPIPVLIC